MPEDEIEINKAIEQELNLYPVIDFIETTPVDSFEMNGKIHFIQY